MIHFDDISTGARRAIVKETAPLVARHNETGLGAPGQPLLLGPSLREEILTLDSVHGRRGKAPESTGQTISLLQAPGEHITLGAGPGEAPRPSGYVRAGPNAGAEINPVSGDDWSVTAVSASDVSGRIQAGLDWIERAVDGNPLVRVLTVPAYQITALTIYDRDNLVGIVALPRLGETLFEPARIYSLEDFKNRLRELPTAEGLAIPK